MSEIIPFEEEPGFVVADERVAEEVRRSGYQLTNAGAAARIKEGDLFVSGVLEKLAQLRGKSCEVVDDSSAGSGQDDQKE